MPRKELVWSVEVVGLVDGFGRLSDYEGGAAVGDEGRDSEGHICS